MPAPVDEHNTALVDTIRVCLCMQLVFEYLGVRSFGYWFTRSEVRTFCKSFDIHGLQGGRCIFFRFSITIVE